MSQMAGSGGTVARASAAVDNLRAVCVLLVVAIHAVLAYLSYLPTTPYAFNKPPFLWRGIPIVDGHRMIGFDIFSAWIDIFVMALFFLLSGLFVWPGLKRKGASAFLQERILRLGLPFAIVVAFLMPFASYPAYLQTAIHPGIADFWSHWRSLPFWPDGPMWFLWVLLVADAAAAGLFCLISPRPDVMSRFSTYAGEHAARFFAGLFVAAAFAYIVLALPFGPMPWAYFGPFSFQLSRPGIYAVFFLAGIVIGANGIERSLIARGDLLARRWGLWLLAAVIAFAIWLGVSAKLFVDPSSASLPWQIGDDLSFALACFSAGCCALALATRFGNGRTLFLDSLQRNSYGIYILHYVFVVWLQFALLGYDWPAMLKAALVFIGALTLSWSTTAGLRRVPGVGHIIGGGRHVAISRLSPAEAQSGLSVTD